MFVFNLFYNDRYRLTHGLIIIIIIIGPLFFPASISTLDLLGAYPPLHGGELPPPFRHASTRQAHISSACAVL